MIEKYLKMYKENLSPSKKDKSSTWQKVEKNVSAKKTKSYGLFTSAFQKLFIVSILLVSFSSFAYLEINRYDKAHRLTPLTPADVQDEIEEIKLPELKEFDTSEEGVDDWEYEETETIYDSTPSREEESLIEIIQEFYDDLINDTGMPGYLLFFLALGSICINLIFAANFIHTFFIRRIFNKKLNSKKLPKGRFISTLSTSGFFITITTTTLILLRVDLLPIWLLVLIPLLVVSLSSILYIIISIIKKLQKKDINLLKRFALGFIGLWQGILSPGIALLLFISFFNQTGVYDYAEGTTAIGGIPSPSLAPGAKIATESTVDESIGYSVGGAKDVNNFRQNIENGYLPLPSDITYEGLYYDYYFDTGQEEACEKLFCPSYSTAISKDPISSKEEYFMTVGLNSGMKESDFTRKKLNLVIVLDISGSMSSPFNKYYYDRYGIEHEIEDDTDSGKTKMQIANESVVALLDHLNEDDQFGMVLFESEAHLAKRLRPVGETDIENLKQHILDITPRGGTYMEAGMKMGTKLYAELKDANQDEYENRIIFITDAMPNIGQTGENSLLGLTEGNADNNLYSTFIGVGVDFNTELIESITKIKGANYYSVYSSKQFKERMDEQFEYMVTPLVFNLKLELEAEGFDIEKVYGSPEADEATGEIMKVNTLFPSKRVEGETKGGIVLLQLKKTVENPSLKLTASYEDREGNADNDQKYVEFNDGGKEYYGNSGIRKAILLTRYVNLIKNWINDERLAVEKNREIQVLVNEKDGIVIPDEAELGEWERQSIDLTVSDQYKVLFQEFINYLETEADILEDENLDQELDILKLMI